MCCWNPKRRLWIMKYKRLWEKVYFGKKISTPKGNNQLFFSFIYRTYWNQWCIIRNKRYSIGEYGRFVFNILWKMLLKCVCNNHSTPSILLPGNIEPPGPKKKRRKQSRQKEISKRDLRKMNRQRGVPYLSTTGKMVAGKTFRPQEICNCRLKCHQHISTVQQKRIFCHFYSLLSAQKKIQYIAGQIHVKPTETRKTDTTRPRTFTRTYYLDGDNGISKNICKSFFIKCLQINSAKIHRVLSTTETMYQKQPEIASVDLSSVDLDTDEDDCSEEFII